MAAVIRQYQRYTVKYGVTNNTLSFLRSTACVDVLSTTNEAGVLGAHSLSPRPEAAYREPLPSGFSLGLGCFATGAALGIKEGFNCKLEAFATFSMMSRCQHMRMSQVGQALI